MTTILDKIQGMLAKSAASSSPLWVVSLSLPNDSLQPNATTKYAILGVYPSRALAEMAAKQCSEELNEPLIAIECRPCYRLLEFNQRIAGAQRCFDQTNLPSELYQPKLQKQEQVDEWRLQQIRPEEIEGPKTHVAQLVYRLYQDELQQRESAQLAQSSQQQYLEQFNELSEILRRHPEAKDQWAAQLSEYLRKTNQEQMTDRIRDCFDRHFGRDRRATLL